MKDAGRPRYHHGKTDYHHGETKRKSRGDATPRRTVAGDNVDEQPANLQPGEHEINERSDFASQHEKREHADEGSPPDWERSSDEDVWAPENNNQWPWGDAGRPSDRGNLTAPVSSQSVPMNHEGSHLLQEEQCLTTEKETEEGDVPS